MPCTPFDLDRALRDALAVYYFPGMWTWNRGVVSPLVQQAFDRSLQGQRTRYEAVGPLGDKDRETLERHSRVGHDLLARYMGWAPEYDLFWPLRVEADFEVFVPDPHRAGADLVAPDGRPIRYQGRIDMLMADQDDARWVVSHRVTDSAFADTDLLRLDEVGLGCCWGWRQDYLTPVAGIVYNELRCHGDPAFRRTLVARSDTELANFGSRLAVVATEMADPGVTPDPYPTPEHCSACAFRRPCLAMNEGSDVEAILSGDYKLRPDDEWVEGRLGAASWSMSRGAAPARFEGGRTAP